MEPALARPLTVWVIEDDAAYRDTLVQLLDGVDGMEANRSFGAVEEALDWVGSLSAEGRAAAPDVLLLDVNLPGRTGIEGLGDLKAKLPETRIVMLTIRDDADTIYGALAAGASGYLVKSASADQLVAAVAEAARGGMLIPAPVARRVINLFRQEETDRDYGLTVREREVLGEMVLGRTQKEIAERLFVSTSTVNSHVQHIYEKLHVRSGSAAVAKALRERLVPDPRVGRDGG